MSKAKQRPSDESNGLSPAHPIAGAGKHPDNDPAGGLDTGPGNGCQNPDQGEVVVVLDADSEWVRPSAAAAGPGGRCHDDPSVSGRYPVLHSWLTTTGLGGQQRRPGTLSISALPGRWKLTLTEPDEGLYCSWVSDAGLWDVLADIDQALKYGRLQWQPSRWKKGK